MELLIIHLTDLHIETENDYAILSNRSGLIGNVVKKHITDSQNTLLLFCITGDIAYSGTEEQYLYASLFFEEISTSIKKQYEDIDVYFILVPGNHDCDFISEENTIRETLLSSKCLDKSKDSIIKSCTNVQKNFFEFCEDWGKNHNSFKCFDKSILTINELNMEEINIKFHCINTAWCSQEHEKKENMMIHIPDIQDKEKNDIVITLMHHDDTWFNWESIEIWKKYYKKFSDIILVGHDHVSEFIHKENYDETSNYFIKGNQLYSSKYPNQSGFNILKIDTTNNVQRFFSYNWSGTLYENIIDSCAQPFIRNRYKKTCIELKKEILSYIEDIEMDLICKNKSPLVLSDIYEFPVFKGDTLNSKKNRTFYIGKDEIINFIKINKYVTIYGEKEYGKTAFIKQLFIEFYEMNLYPLFLDVEELKTADGEELNKEIAKFYDREYDNLNEESIIQMEPEKKVCIIDDFENINLSDKMCKKLLQYLMDKFGIVIITSNLQNDMLNFFKYIETKEYLQDKFSRLTIQELKNYSRRRLVDKWLLLSDTGQNINSQGFDVLRKNKLDQVQSVMKKGYFNKTPIEFLLVLSYLDNYEKMNTDYSRFSYIYDCLILDKLNEMANRDTNEATMYKTILEQLAYRMYCEQKTIHVDESFIIGVIFDYNQEYTGVRGEIINTVNNLVKHKILDKKNDKYRFRYNYMYYYFAGSYIKGQLEPKIREEKIVEIFSDLSIELNFNIALFLAYSMNTEFDILPKMVNVSNNLLAKYKNFKYEQQDTLISKLNINVTKKMDKIFAVPLNDNIPLIQERNALLSDAIDSFEEEISEEAEKELTEKEQDELDKMTHEVFKTLRSIEFLGSIIKNYSSSIKKAPRMEIISIMYTSTMKVMGSLCNAIELFIDSIISVIEEKEKNGDDRASIVRSEFETEIKSYISLLWSKFIEINSSNMAYSLQCDRITQDIAEFRNEINSEFFDMVNIEFLIRTLDGHLPTKEISNCVKGKNKLGVFTLDRLKNNIAFYLRNYQFNSHEKQVTCSLLDFNIKDMLIEEQKGIARNEKVD